MFVSGKGPNFFSVETMLLQSVSFIIPDRYKLFSIGKIILPVLKYFYAILPS